MRSTGRNVHHWYKELKLQELTKEQFLKQVTVINDGKAWWGYSKHKEDNEEKHPSLSNKRVKAIKKKTRNVHMSMLKSSIRN